MNTPNDLALFDEPNDAHDEHVPARRSPHPHDRGLFDAWWTTLEGKRIRRIRRDEFAELHRLWNEHADIRLRGGDVL
jgi:hypothetical protein